MIEATLSQAATWVDGILEGRDGKFVGVSTDTRKLARGQLFAALKGPHFDAHEFVERAAALGAAGALVDGELSAPTALLRVADTRVALGQLASIWRQNAAVTVAAVTGSNGKTTVKEMLGSILASQGSILMTRGNFNNDIGLPLTLFELNASHRWAVLELGANHPGEIAYLGNLAMPAVAVITNAGPAHLEGFGTVQGAARAKGELIGTLDAGGIAVFNGDDDYVEIWRSLCGGRSHLEFGLGEGCEVRGEIRCDGFDLVYEGERRRVHMPMPGRHNVMNALAAAGGALALGVDLDAIATGLEAASPVPGRLGFVSGLHDSRLVDDTYNANPQSLYAALETVAAGSGEHWLVLGDMKELGEHSAEMHAAAGERARALGFRRLFSLGSQGADAARSFGGGGKEFDNVSDLCDALREALPRSEGRVTVLIKGSRGMRMERVVEALRMPQECS